jgi:hypothetical protein
MIVTLMKRHFTLSDIGNYLVVLLLALVPFYAFLTVFGSTLVGHYTVLRLWDSVMTGILSGVVIVWLGRDKVLLRRVTSNIIFRLIAVYIVLTVALGITALIKKEVTIKAVGFSWIVNVRFLVWFMGVSIVAERSTWLQRYWRPVVFWGAWLVCVFALIQFFLLSPKFLAHFGYDSLKNVAPVTTINQSTGTVRVQSFLRGPNPLGAYMVLVLGIVVSFLKRDRKSYGTWALGAIALITILLTFSRSAWIGASIAIVGAAFLALRGRRQRILAAWSLAVVCVCTLAGLIIFSHTAGVQNAILHVTPEAKLKDTSNHGHSIALHQAVQDLVREPFGDGPGSAGPASLYNQPHAPRNSENYFLEIGLETGWAGLLLFVAITILLALELWERREDPLARALFATLIGITVVNQFSYAWTDDTLAYIWWGLAGLALGLPLPGKLIEKSQT